MQKYGKDIVPSPFPLPSQPPPPRSPSLSNSRFSHSPPLQTLTTLPIPLSANRSIQMNSTLPNLCNFSSLLDHPPEYTRLVWISNSILLPFIALLGIVCNVINITVLTSTNAARRMPSWSLLVSLSLCDAFFLFFALMESSPLGLSITANSPLLNRYYAYSALYARAAASTFYKSSILIVLSFNLERFVYVVCPLGVHRLCTEKGRRCAIGGSIVFSLLCSLQWPLCYRITACLHPFRNQLMHSIVLRDNSFLQAYYSFTDIFTLFVFNLLPILALLLLNSKLILTLKRVSNDDSKRKCGVDYKESSTSRSSANAMLFSVVIALLFCLGSQAPARLLFSLLGQYHPVAILYASLSQQLVFLNASLNFILYSLVSKRYRELFKSAVSKVCGRGKQVFGSPPFSVPWSRSQGSRDTQMEHLSLQPRGSILSHQGTSALADQHNKLEKWKNVKMSRKKEKRKKDNGIDQSYSE